MSLIQVSNIQKIYNENTDIELRVLKGINVSINKGEFVSIMGPSGSGKSTLMNILGFLDTPNTGTYQFEGENTVGYSEEKLANIRNKKVGFVFQQFHLLKTLTAAENVALPLLYAGISQKNRIKKAEEILEKVGLGDRTHHLPSELSGGQQQRVSIARALVNNPSIIFADEPTGNLDTRTSQEIMKLLQDLQQKDGRTIVMVTHEPDMAEFTSRILTIKDGLLEKDEQNTPKQVFLT